MPASDTRPQNNRPAAQLPAVAGSHFLEIDWSRRRLWVAGQRLHHGLTGVLLAGAGLAGIAAHSGDARRSFRWALLGTMLMAHDWHDREIWFERGPGTQP
jgi:hypothetical protein